MTIIHAIPLRLYSGLCLGLCWVLIAALLPACVTTTAELPEQPYLVALGTAQDGGLPQLGCRRDCCETARKDARRARLVASLLVVDPRTSKRWLIDASPDLSKQVERSRGHAEPKPQVGKRTALFDGIFLTHAHLGHYTGLLQLGREAYGTQTTPVMATERMLQFLTSEGPWSLLFEADHLQALPLNPGETVQLADDLSVTAWSVPHRDEFSDTVCFVIQGPNRSALYLPDIDKWQHWDRSLGKVLQQVDMALIDGTFFGPDELPGRDMAEVPHPFIVETLQQLSSLPEDLSGKVIFTHLNHSNPAADPRSEAAQEIRAAGAAVLGEGAILEL